MPTIKSATAVKSAAKTPVSKVANPTTPEPEVIDANDSVFRQMFNEAFSEIAGFEIPSWKRTLCAMLATLAVGVGTACVTNAVLGWLMAGALAAAVPYFIAVVIYAIGFIVAAYFGAKLAARIGGMVLTGKADEHAKKSYTKTIAFVKSMNPFGKEPSIESA